MTEKEQITRKSNVEYWDEFWRRASGQTADSYYRRRLDKAFTKALDTLETQGMSLLEVGVGGSEYLPYFHRRFGFRVGGIDYSQTGCVTARELLAATGTPGDIRQADMFAPPTDLLGRFDVVISMGLVEHFTETATAVGACAAFARPGGLLITVIPNMRGLYGKLCMIFNRAVFDTHVPLDLEQLMQAHRDCGLRGVEGEYLLGLPGVVDGARYEPVRLRRYLRKLTYVCSRAYWALEEKGFGVPENSYSSPYMICVAQVPDGFGS